ncbi:MAG: flagellar biosynthetic protein FliO [Deltaproteobacteria bacterium]|nr:flagellar biosynthetic protein FliO [Deltaproteobacteria bacterium]
MDTISFFWSFFKMLTALAVVIALMIMAMYLLKKYFYQPSAAVNGNSMIHIISTCHLSPKNSILLVDVLGQVMLLGVSNHQMSILGTITDPVAMENLKNFHLTKKSLPTSDTLSRYKSLLRNIGQMRKSK